MDVTVVVPSFGDASWYWLAETRAVRSVKDMGVPVIHIHARTLCEARNLGLELVQTEWVCFLDADDELEPGYFEAMAWTDGYVRVPQVRRTDGESEDRVPWFPKVVGHEHQCFEECLAEGNWVVVGAVVLTDLLREVGGWPDYPIWEDWAVWLKCALAGARFDRVPDAVYRAYMTPGSRNQSLGYVERAATRQAILAANGLA